MYSGGLMLLFGLAGVLWLGTLTYAVLKLWRVFKVLVLVNKTGRSVKIQEMIRLLEGLENLDNKFAKFIQKAALLRYNPYKDTGGDQSFSLALLNENGDGIVLTSLHARSGTRVFAKEVSNGAKGNIELSSEEEQVIKQALGS